jgi:para-aminobenzoate synthetase/4-amino-4-deoxychorismate lyase
MRFAPGEGIALLEGHLARLARSADYFGFSLNLPKLRAALAALASRLPPVEHRIRLLLSRSGAFRCEASPLPSGGLRFGDIGLAAGPVDGRDPFLYHKTTRRIAYEKALTQSPGATDILLFNELGEVTESTIANAAFEIDGLLWTPPVRCGLLAGVQRDRLLAEGGLRERVVTVAEALQCGGVYLMNALRGLQRVRIIDPPQ